jgi:hypothetical protein
MHDHDKEPMELKHDPLPGYRPAFFVALAVGIIYMGVILYNTL